MISYTDGLKDQIIEQYYKVKQAIIGNYNMYVLLHKADYYKLLMEEREIICYQFNSIWGMPLIISSDVEQGSPKVLIDIFPKEKFRQ